MQKGLKNAIKLAKKAANGTTAYRTFLKQKKINFNINSETKFFKLPVLDKTNYIKKNSISHLTLNHTVPSVVYASSGSSGKPTFWAKGEPQEKIGAEIHELIFSNIFGFKKDEPTLVIICFSMGVWVAGNFTLACCKLMAKNGYKISSLTTGIEKTDIFFALENLAKEFKNVVLAGYPPFIMDIISESKSKQINLPKNLKILTSGDKFSEKFRDRLIELAGLSDPLSSVISLYGSADVGPMGFETPLTIFLRREAQKNNVLKQTLFGETAELPSFLQYNPHHIFFENINDELVLTADAGIPLVRYNIHDQGRLLSFKQVQEIISSLGLTKQAETHGLGLWEFPFLIKTGRTDVAVNFYALNILPEHIQASLQDKQIFKKLNGNFFAYHKMIKNHAQEELGLIVETKNKRLPGKKFAKKIQTSFVKTLTSLSLEFRKLYQTIGSRALPKIMVIKPGDLIKYSKKQHLGLLYIQGRKPRVKNFHV